MCLQVHLLTRLLTLLDLLHTQANQIHGNITPHHVLVDPLAHPKAFYLTDLACARTMGGAPPAALYTCTPTTCLGCAQLHHWAVGPEHAEGSHGAVLLPEWLCQHVKQMPVGVAGDARWHNS